MGGFKRGTQLSITSGVYTGDDTVNRAIPHNLQKTPKLVLILCESVGATWILSSIYVGVVINIGISILTVTSLNSTSFYVGNIAHYSNSANLAGSNYKWVTIG
jgi:hypothetical protein